jgi:hypothetical protein
MKDMRRDSGAHYRFPLSPVQPERNSAIACLIIVSIFFVCGPFLGFFALFNHIVGESLGAWLGPVLLLGVIAAAVIAIIRWQRFRRLYAPRLEISHHPLSAGAVCQAHLSQNGPLKIDAVRVLLVCEEKASYTDGTVTRWAKEQVYKAEQWQAEDLELTREKTLEQEFTVTIPEGAMHSFKSAHNFISWRLLVEEQLQGRRKPWRNEFEIILRETAEADE